MTKELSGLGLGYVRKYEYGYIPACTSNTILLILLPNKVFMRDADQVEAWISTQESFIAGDDYGVSGARPIGPTCIVQCTLNNTCPLHSQRAMAVSFEMKSVCRHSAQVKLQLLH